MNMLQELGRRFSVAPDCLKNVILQLDAGEWRQQTAFQPDKGPPVVRSLSSPLPTFEGRVAISGSVYEQLIDVVQQETSFILFTEDGANAELVTFLRPPNLISRSFDTNGSKDEAIVEFHLVRQSISNIQT